MAKRMLGKAALTRNTPNTPTTPPAPPPSPAPPSRERLRALEAQERQARRELREAGAPLDAADPSLRPWTETSDLNGWEVIADAETHGPMGFVIQVRIPPAVAPAVVRAARREGLDVSQWVQRRVDNWTEELAAREG